MVIWGKSFDDVRYFADDCDESLLLETVGGVEKLANTRLCTWWELLIKGSSEIRMMVPKDIYTLIFYVMI